MQLRVNARPLKVTTTTPMRGASDGSPAAVHGPLSRRRATQGVVQVGDVGQFSDQPVQPAEHDLPTAQVAHALDLQPERGQAREQRIGGYVHEVSRQVQRKPVVTEDLRLEAAGVG